jgi:hypothetical protein
MIRPRFLLLLLIAVGLSQPVLAQISPFRGSRAVPLDKDDISALTAATYPCWTRRDLSRAPPRLGVALQARVAR